MISPIESFPGKLLVAIAAAAQEDHAPDEAFLSPTLKPEWALSQTCARFREVIVGAPVLWTFVECDLACDDSVTRMYLERSRGCKIWAEVYYGPYYPGGNSVVLAERFHQIVSHFNRIWRLRILVNTEVSMALAEVLWAPLRDIAAPDLQHLEIKYEMRDYIVRESGRPVTLFSAGAPRLTLVKLVNFIPFPMPWVAQLKHLEMWCTNAVKERLFIDIAAQCSSLAHLYLDVCDVSVEMGHQFHIPSLKSLHITISDNEDHDFLPHALDIFNTPALIELIIDNAHGDQIFPFVDSISLRQASFPALVSLSFIKCHTCSCEYHGNPPPHNFCSSHRALSCIVVPNTDQPMLYCTTCRKHLGLVLAALAAFADRHNMSLGALVEGSLRRPPNLSAFETPAWTGTAQAQAFHRTGFSRKLGRDWGRRGDI